MNVQGADLNIFFQEVILKKIEKILIHFRKDGKRMDEQLSIMDLFRKLGGKYNVSVKEISEIPGEADLIISCGGDGTFLDAARTAFLQNVPVAGINIGHMGFLTEINPEEESMIENLFSGNFEIKQKMMIDISVLREDSEVFRYTALNEAIVHRETHSGMICFGIDYNDETLPEYKGDGVIISTPTGSTAYNLSCNGPIIYPTESSLVINAIAPHALTHRPIVLPADGTINVYLKDCGQAVLLCDGKSSIEIFEKDVITIGRSAGKLMVVSNPHRSFFDILSKKLHFGRRL